MDQEWGATIKRANGAPFERAAATEATLDELAEKLSELRQHLEQVLTVLNGATSEGHADNAGFEASRLRCHACGRTESTERAGWTLRLCGDDELHPYCPDCDRLHVDGEGRNGTSAHSAGHASSGLWEAT